MADFVSQGLVTSQNGYRHAYGDLLTTVLAFVHSKVSSNPSRTILVVYLPIFVLFLGV